MNWYPWGTEAFRAARRLDRPIFLSIGYSTCYWCHVMERESFENVNVAARLNEGFIAIKVDREERPDVDDLYMTAVQIMSGHGGWPMSVFLEPATLKPFYAGTYFPPNDAYGRPGFLTVLARVQDAWRNRRGEIDAHANTVAEAIAQHVQGEGMKRVALDRSHIEACINQLMFTHDPVHGGFGSGSRAPKFPTPGNMLFLLEAGHDRSEVVDAVGHTLTQMALGGIDDHLAGGFHRYSVDERWLVPHFEKMLYDQALMVLAICAYLRVREDAWLRRVLRETVDFVVREMRERGGTFVSAIDAETNAREGLSYIWTRDEVRSALRMAELEGETEFVLALFGMDGAANFSDPHHPEAEPAWVLHRPLKPDDAAKRMGIEVDEFERRSGRVREALQRARAQRNQPTTDHKIIAGWNGLMVAACAHAAEVLGDEDVLDAARRAMDAVLKHCVNERAMLLRVPSASGVETPAPLEDYAFLIHGLLELGKATGDDRWTTESQRWCQHANQRFWNEQGGFFHETLEDQADLFVRLRSIDDGAVPSSSSMMALNLLELARLRGENTSHDQARQLIGSLSGVIAEQPMRCVLAVLAAHRTLRATNQLNQPQEVSIRGGVVQVEVNPAEVTFGADRPAVFEIVLSVAPPYFIHASDGTGTNGMPLRVEALPGSGWSVEVQYPHATQRDIDGVGIHRGTIVMKCALRGGGGVEPTVRLMVMCQPCREDACLEAIRIPVMVRVVQL